MPEMVTRWLATDGTLHETELAAKTHEQNRLAKQYLAALIAENPRFSPSDRAMVFDWVWTKKNDIFLAFLGEDPKQGGGAKVEKIPPQPRGGPPSGSIVLPEEKK